MVHLTSQVLKRYHKGHVVIRMALGGCTNRPFYRIVAAFNKKSRDGKHLDKLGTYDPLPNAYNEKLISLNVDRIKHWFACGAHLTKPTAKLLGLAGFFPLHPMTITAAERLRKAKAEAAAQAEESPKEEAAAQAEESPKEEAAAQAEESPKEEAAAQAEESPKEEAAAQAEESPKEEAAAQAEESPKGGGSRTG